MGDIGMRGISVEIKVVEMQRVISVGNLGLNITDLAQYYEQQQMIIQFLQILQLPTQQSVEKSKHI